MDFKTLKTENEIMSWLKVGYDLVDYGWGWFLRRDSIYDDLDVFKYHIPLFYNVDRKIVVNMVESNKLSMTNIYKDCYWAKLKNKKS